MELDANVFDVWVFRRGPAGPEYLLLHTSQLKAERYFNGGRFWQIPCGFVVGDGGIVPALDGLPGGFGLAASAVLKEGLQSTREFVTGRATPPRELRLRWSGALGQHDPFVR